MDPEIIAGFSSGLNPLEVLSDLERRNLFIHRLPQVSGTPVFRFNKLFRGYLLSLFRSSTSPEEFRTLSARIGAIYDGRQQFDAAIRYYIQAGEHRLTADLITKTGTDLVITGRLTDLAAHIGTLPDDMVWSDPWLVYFLTMTRRIRGGKHKGAGADRPG
jgi:ATP/maltotriose-dependent transcriptional regulator MalT